MLVNAHDFPGPALFQGLGLIAIAIWFVFVQPALNRRREARDTAARRARWAAEVAEMDRASEARMARFNALLEKRKRGEYVATSDLLWP